MSDRKAAGLLLANLIITIIKDHWACFYNNWSGPLCVIHSLYTNICLSRFVCVVLKAITLIILFFLFSYSRDFQLYLTTNTDLFTEKFKAVIVDKHGNEKNFDVPLQNFFTGHVVGESKESNYLLLFLPPFFSG